MEGSLKVMLDRRRGNILKVMEVRELSENRGRGERT